MAAIATQTVALPSTTPAYVAASGGGDTFVPGDRSFLIVKNGGGASINVTVATYPDVSEWGAAVADLIVAVPAAGERWIGPLRGSVFSNTAVAVTYSAVTSVTVAAVSV